MSSTLSSTPSSTWTSLSSSKASSPPNSPSSKKTPTQCHSGIPQNSPNKAEWSTGSFGPSLSRLRQRTCEPLSCHGSLERSCERLIRRESFERLLQGNHHRLRESDSSWSPPSGGR